MIAESDCVKLGKLQDDMLSRARQKNSINSQSVICAQSAVCSLHFASGLQPAFYSLHFVLTGLVLLFLFERASSPDRNIEAPKINFKLSWPLWLMCELYVEELPWTSTMIEQWLLYTNWRRIQMHGLPIWLPLMLFCVVTACVEMNPLRVWTFRLLDSSCILEVRKCDLRLLFLLTHKNVLFLSTWVSELIEIDFDFH